MVEIYDSHEQSERVKNWLQTNGGAILMGLVLAFGSLFGLKQWQSWQESKDQRASAEYELMVSLLGDNNLDAAVSNYETLKAEFSGSPYTALASMQMASARIAAGQSELAVAMLEHAMAEAEPGELRLVARQRLARVMLELGQPEEASALLDGAKSTAGFEALFAEIRGDIARVQGRLDEAARFYQDALDRLETGTGNRAFLEIKLQSVAAGDGGAAS